jgi:hypothetical protein
MYMIVVVRPPKMLKPIYQTTDHHTRGKLIVKIFIHCVSSESKVMCKIYNIVQWYGMHLIVLQFVRVNSNCIVL